MKFSEWTKRSDAKILETAAGDTYEQLSETAKNCIDDAVNRFIKQWTLLPLEDKKETPIDINLNRALIAHDLECEAGKEFNLTDKQYETIIDYVALMSVEFCDWAYDNGYIKNYDGFYYYESTGNSNKKTTQELYQIFKNPNKQ